MSAKGGVIHVEDGYERKTKPWTYTLPPFRPGTLPAEDFRRVMCEEHGGLWPDLAIPVRNAASVVIPEGVRRAGGATRVERLEVLDTEQRRISDGTFAVFVACARVYGDLDGIFVWRSVFHVRTQGMRPSLSTLA